MSTLAATKADGFYYPPDWTPEGGSASLARKFNKNGSLGKRANKLNEGKLTVRFEMPYNVGCRRCGQMIARGVRFNAEKKMVGKYHSTPIYAFTMLSRCCANRLEIHTDPKEAEYIIVSGADRKIGGAGAATRYNDHAKALDAEGTTEIELQSREERDAMMADPMGRLERTVGMVRAADVTDGDDPTNASTRAPATFIELRDQSKNRWKDDYEANRTLRRAMRGQRKEIKALKEELTGMGYDVDEFNRIGELKAIKRAVEDGTVDSIFDKVWYSRAAMAAGSGSIVDVQKVQAYWKGKGITVKTLADLDKVTAYMIKKYGKDAKMGMM